MTTTSPTYAKHGIENQYGRPLPLEEDKNKHAWRWVDRNHTPYNKRPYEGKSVAKLEVHKSNRAGWLEITASETIARKDGTPVTRTVHMTLSEDAVTSLFDYLLPDRA